MNIDNIRKIFLDFFQKKGHKFIPSSSLVPKNDNTLLFTNAGMNQFKDEFLNPENSSYKKVVTSQRCIRAGGKHNDLENVGYTNYHHTFFEMLGNFSFGDYFKYDAIKYAWELLTDKNLFNLSKDSLFITVYNSDYESYDIWREEIKIPKDRIIKIGDKNNILFCSDNFWQMGNVGPCGPCSEIFYNYKNNIIKDKFNNLQKNNNNYIEIWNLVFMQFNRRSDGKLISLPKPSVDTGMGLERIASILQNVNSNYEIDLFKKIICSIIKIINNNNLNNKSLHVIADHIRSCVFLINDGILPSNYGRGYVLRRIIRRAIRHARNIGYNKKFFYKLVSPLIEIMGNVSKKLQKQKTIIENIIYNEEEQFSRTLNNGLIFLNKKINILKSNTLDGKTAFLLHDTYGFPLDLTIDICKERNLKVNKKEFEFAMSKQKKLSYKNNTFNKNYDFISSIKEITNFVGYDFLNYSGKIINIFQDKDPVNVIFENEKAVIILNKTTFYAESGGQVGDIGILKGLNGTFQVINTKKYGKIIFHIGKVIDGNLKLGEKITSIVDINYRNSVCLNHSAVHLLHSSLRKILNNNITQKGSLINSHYFRFDFNYEKPLNIKQIYLIEDMINEKIRNNIIVNSNNMNFDDAIKIGALALFNEKYEKKVRVITIDNFSIELCCGTHVKSTGDIGIFRILSESSSSHGIRRIEGTTGKQALLSIHNKDNLIYNISKILKCDANMLINNISYLKKELNKSEKDIKKLIKYQAFKESLSLIKQVKNINGTNIIISHLKDLRLKTLKIMIDMLKNKLKSVIIVLSTIEKKKITIITSVTKNLENKINAVSIIKHLIKQIGGNGGGNTNFAQSGGGNINKLKNALIDLNIFLKKKIK